MSGRESEPAGAGVGSRHRYAVVVAGGAGTRLWPLSRRDLPKQMQALMSDKALITETVDRLRGVVPLAQVFISTTENYRDTIAELLPDIDPGNLIVEPEARGTPAAFALFAAHIHRLDPEAAIFSLASDHAITEIDRFQETVRSAYDAIEAQPGAVAIVGIKPTRPDTGLGYIKVHEPAPTDAGYEPGHHPLRVEKYVEKPSYDVAASYVESGDFYWNSAYYCFRADTLLKAYRDAEPRLVDAAMDFLERGDPSAYLSAPVRAHEIDLIDTSRFPLLLVPADFTWSDIGNWAALHRSLSALLGSEVVSANARDHIDVHSSGCLVVNSDRRVVVTAGLDDIAVISTDDAVMVINMARLEEMPATMQELFTRLRGAGKGALL
ncbi:MAG: mannose-1-phosphate guanylyltransferase [Nocardioides sp.]